VTICEDSNGNIHDNHRAAEPDSIRAPRTLLRSRPPAPDADADSIPLKAGDAASDDSVMPAAGDVNLTILEQRTPKAPARLDHRHA
jgi:hypothetical protein